MNLLNTRKYPLKAQYFISIALVFIVATASFYTVNYTGYRVVALVLLMTVSFIAMLFDIFPVLVAAILSAIIWNFFFIPPLFTFHIYSTEDVLMFLLYFIIALVNAVLTFKIKQAEKKARDKEEKENTIKLYNTLLNSLSHELRTPISTIIGAVDTLKESKEKLSQNNQNELLTEIDKASVRLNRQVENLLNMSRLESGMLKPKLDWCDLNELINSVIQKFLPVEHHTIVFQPNENLPLFKLDAGLLDQILYNLIHNAIQYTPDKTCVTIKCENVLNLCVITVSDNGNGFKENEIAFVFDKFYRVPNTKTGGSGLGLSIVKGFVEALNGKINLSNNQNYGAKFTIEIPAETSFLNSLKNE
ncbi:MAG: ATP-binding protein [Bacteroidota bacterium]